MKGEVTDKHLRKHVHTGLKLRIGIYLGLALLVIMAVAYRIVALAGGVEYPLLALGAGLVSGTVVSRMFAVEWDRRAKKVISRMDTYGLLILAAYFIFQYEGERFIKDSFSGTEVTTVILALVSGAFLGRGLGMGRRMYAILKEHV